MTSERQDRITVLLADLAEGQEGADDALAGLVYDDLRAMAERHLKRVFGSGAAALTLQPTALADDTIMRMIKQRQEFDSRGHFFAIATKMMLRVLGDYCDHRRAAKRGGGKIKVSFGPEHDVVEGRGQPTGVGALTEALEKLDGLYPRKADVVRYRFLWGLSVAETAEALGVGIATIDRDWRFAKAWLAKELSE